MFATRKIFIVVRARFKRVFNNRIIFFSLHFLKREFFGLICSPVIIMDSVAADRARNRRRVNILPRYVLRLFDLITFCFRARQVTNEQTVRVSRRTRIRMKRA